MIEDLNEVKKIKAGDKVLVRFNKHDEVFKRVLDVTRDYEENVLNNIATNYGRIHIYRLI